MRRKLRGAQGTVPCVLPGFQIADEDLKLRGPGDFFGERQHGLINLKIANLLTDMDTLRATGDAARTILEADPLLQAQKYAGLKQGVERFFHDRRLGAT